MKNLLFSTWLAIRRRLRRPGAVLGLLLLPVAMVLAGLLLPAETLEEPVEIGLCRPAEPSGTADALCDLLMEGQGGYIRFQEADAETARIRVAAGSWDCAFLLEDGFDEVLRQGGHPITLIRSPGSVLPSIAQEAVSAALLRVRTGALAGEYLTESGLLPSLTPEEAAGMLSLQNSRPMTVLQVGEAGARSLTATLAPSLIRGIITILLFMEALLAGAELRRARRSPFHRRALPVMGEARLSAPLLMERALIPWAAGALALLAASRFLPAAGQELGVLLLYQLALTPLTMLVARIPAVDEWLYVALPYTAVACLLLSPVLLDTGSLIPALYPATRALPPTWYLLAADGENKSLLFGALAVLWGTALLLEGLCAWRAACVTDERGQRKG